MADSGSKGVGGGQAPSLAQEIVRKMQEGEQNKKLDQKEQITQLRRQASTQESLKESTHEKKTLSEDKHTEEGHGHQDHAATGQARARTAQGTAETGRKETAMDAFLSRTSQQQQQRSAGQEMSKPQTLSSVSPQAWSVPNSPQTPEAARAVILAQHAQSQNFVPQSPAGKNQTPTGQTYQPTPGIPFVQQGENLSGTLIQYARATQSGGETSARAFTSQALLPENMSHTASQLIQNQMSAMAQRALSQNVPVAVQIRGPLIFVKDGKEFRAFKLNKDGSLTELPTEDSKGHPLSAEAQKMLQKVMRQKGLQGHADSHTSEDMGKVLEELQANEHREGQKSSGGEEGLDFETKFALLLHSVLEENHQIGKKLKNGEIVFGERKDWEAFFAKMLKMGNQEKTAKKAMEDVLNMIFRGLFKKQGQGENVLVGDFKYLKNGKTKEEKFAQVTVEDEKLLELLAQLKPGQKITAEMLKKFFGEEMSYLQLAHITEKLFNMSQGAEKNVIFNPRAQTDPYSQARLEKSMFASRKPNKSTASSDEALSQELPRGSRPTGFLANGYEFLGLRERFEGKPRLYTFITYSLLIAAFGITVVFLLMKFL